jgi:hypothetical protein
MIYAHKGYKIDNNKSLELLNLKVRDCYAQYKCNGNLKSSGNSDVVYWTLRCTQNKL